MRTPGVVAGGVVKRGEHDVELGERPIRQVERAVGQNVHLDAVQNGQIRHEVSRTRSISSRWRRTWSASRPRPTDAGEWSVMAMYS